MNVLQLRLYLATICIKALLASKVENVVIGGLAVFVSAVYGNVSLLRVRARTCLKCL
jgi:hypothetical protein